MEIGKNKLTIIFEEPLTSSDKISDFIIRSLNDFKGEKLYDKILNNIENFKTVEIKDYDNMCKYLNLGYTIILIENGKNAIGLETKADLGRSISIPDTEATLRGAKDSFVEDIQKISDLSAKELDIMILE